MSITVTPGATISSKDSGISADPNEIPFGGSAIKCPAGVMAQDVVLAAASSNVALTFPVGLSTAAFLAINAVNISDLIVKVSGQSLTVPIGQPLFLYNVAASAISVSSVLGGKIAYVVGG